MAESNSTKQTARPILDIASDLEDMQRTLTILTDMTIEQACNWSTTDNPDTVGRMVERLIVLGNTTSDKLAGLNGLVAEAYALGFKSSPAAAAA